MTLVELNERIAGYNEREDARWQRHAKLTAYIVSAMTGKQYTARKLMPEVFPAQPVPTKEERQRELQEIRENVGLGGIN